MADAAAVRGLTRYFGDHCVLNGVDLRLPVGSIYGLLGRNGAGKTTLIKILLGFLRPTRGTASLLGSPADRLPLAVRARVGYLAEGHHLYGSMTIDEHYRFTKPFYPRWSDDAYRRLLAYYELQPKRRVGTLSRGQQAQVSLVLCLATQPELLIMDDPTLGLDPAVRREFLDSMITLIQQEGRTILFSSHILGDVERIADHIGIIEQGELLVDCPLATLQERVRCVTMTFAGEPPAGMDVPELLAVRRVERTLHLTVTRYDADLHARLAMLQPATLEVQQMNLEEIFLAYTSDYRRLAQQRSAACL
ncbi:MAG TPA: ABC transporter ATP-binding protein [bacterium]|nr:ABC transporter ATP-binding protein [bacterium]